MSPCEANEIGKQRETWNPRRTAFSNVAVLRPFLSPAPRRLYLAVRGRRYPDYGENRITPLGIIVTIGSKLVPEVGKYRTIFSKQELNDLIVVAISRKLTGDVAWELPILR